MKGLLRYKNGIIIVAVLVIFLIISKNFHSRFTLEMEEWEQKIAQLKEARILVEKWTSVKRDYEKAQDVFFGDDILSFTGFIDEQAKKFDVKIGYAGQARRDKNLYWEAILDLRITASYDSLAEFIKSVEAEGIEIERLTVKGNPQPSQEGIEVVVVLKGLISKD